MGAIAAFVATTGVATRLAATAAGAAAKIGLTGVAAATAAGDGLELTIGAARRAGARRRWRHGN